jgi:hypothetical protein
LVLVAADDLARLQCGDLLDVQTSFVENGDQVPDSLQAFFGFGAKPEERAAFT